MLYKILANPNIFKIRICRIFPPNKHTNLGRVSVDEPSPSSLIGTKDLTPPDYTTYLLVFFNLYIDTVNIYIISIQIKCQQVPSPCLKHLISAFTLYQSKFKQQIVSTLQVLVCSRRLLRILYVYSSQRRMGTPVPYGALLSFPK